MAKLKKNRKGKAPTLEESSENLGEVKEVFKALNFKIPQSLHKEMKRFALSQDITMTELLIRSFDHYKHFLANKDM